MHFPDNPGFTGINEPHRAEIDIIDLEVDGEIPADINGAFYRVQPDFIYPPRFDNDVPFNGDGHVSMFRIQNGHVDYKSRYAQTQRYKAQKAARKALFGTYRNRDTDDPSVRHLSGGTANTNLIYHAGKLFAMKEDSPPVQMDPNTLETLDDYYTFNGKMEAQTFSAHPKICPVTGEMFTLCYEAKGNASRDVAFYSFDKSGQVNWQAWIEVPYAGMLHDFVVTQTYIAFLVIPMAVNVEQMQRGGVHYAWDSSLPTYFGVLARGGDGTDLRWYKGPERCATHVMNGFADGTKLYVDMDMAESNQFPFFPMLNGQFNPKKAEGRLTRLSVDLSKNEETYTQEILYPHSGVLPKTDERYWGLPYKVGFMPVVDPSKPVDGTFISPTGLIMNTWVRFDHNVGKATNFWVGDDASTLQEPQFIPRRDGAEEGDGYLIGLCNRHSDRHTDLLILDTQHLDEGPIATAKLPFALRNGVHGMWLDESHLA